MDIKIRRFGSTEVIKPAILSYTDGVLLEDDWLDYSDLEAKGLVYSRFAHTTNPDDQRAEVLREDIRIISPEELGGVQYVLADGALVLIRNLETGELDKPADAMIDDTLAEYLASIAEATEDEDEGEVLGALNDLLGASWDEDFEGQSA